MKELFKNKNYILLFWGFMVSALGNVIFGFAAGLYVADLTGRPLMLALFMALSAGMRILFSPLAGSLVDRWNKVKILYTCDFIHGLMFLVVAFLFYRGLTPEEATIVLLISVSISGIISAFFGPSVTSGTPEIVGMDHVQAANGANSIVESTTGIVGVILGAIAFNLFSFEVAILINGISFLLSGISETFIKAEFKEDIEPSAHTSMIDDIKFGFRYIGKNRGLLNLILFALFINFAMAPMFSVGFPSLLRIQLERSAWEIAWINIAFGIAMLVAGILVGGMVIKNYTKMIRMNLSFLVLTFVLMTATIYLLNAEVIGFWLFYGIMIGLQVCMACFMIATNVPLNTGMVKVIDANVRGRVFATLGALSSGLTPIAILLAGVIIEATSVSVLGLICSAIMLIPTIGMMTNKKVGVMLDSIPTTSTLDSNLDLV